MSTTSDVGIFRATVKGKFANLTDQAMAYLTAEAGEHTYFKSAYTQEGTFVYDAEVKFFSLRYEVRVTGDGQSGRAEATALAEAENFLTTMGFGYTKLRVDVVDLNAMWAQS